MAPGLVSETIQPLSSGKAGPGWRTWVQKPRAAQDVPFCLKKKEMLRAGPDAFHRLEHRHLGLATQRPGYPGMTVPDSYPNESRRFQKVFQGFVQRLLGGF